MKSLRYAYSTHPCFEKPSKKARKKLHKTFRAYTRQTVRVKEEFEPMPRRYG